MYGLFFFCEILINYGTVTMIQKINIKKTWIPLQNLIDLHITTEHLRQKPLCLCIHPIPVSEAYECLGKLSASRGKSPICWTKCEREDQENCLLFLRFIDTFLKLITFLCLHLENTLNDSFHVRKLLVTDDKKDAISKAIKPTWTHISSTQLKDFFP